MLHLRFYQTIEDYQKDYNDHKIPNKSVIYINLEDRVIYYV